MPGVPLADFLTVWTILALNIVAPGRNVLNTIAVAIGAGRGAALAAAAAGGVALGIHAVYALAFSAPPATRAYLRAAPFISLGVALFFGFFALMLLASIVGPQ